MMRGPQNHELFNNQLYNVVHVTAKCWLDAELLTQLVLQHSATSFRETWLSGLGVYMVPGRKKEEGIS